MHNITAFLIFYEYKMQKVTERSISLESAESIIDSYFKDKAFSVNIDIYGNTLSSTVATIASNNKEEPCVGCGKGYEHEARVGAKFEAYEHYQGLSSLREHRMLAPFSLVIEQTSLNSFFPLSILKKSSPTNISVIPFDHPFKKEDNKLLYPSFLIDYNHIKNRLTGDDVDYSAVRRYSCGTGIAAGVGYIEAAIHAVSEVIERHCVGRFLAKTFFYEIQSVLPRINPETMPLDLQQVLHDAEQQLNAEIQVIDISCNNLPTVIIACCKERNISGVHVFGAGCSIYSSHAAIRAIKELVQQYCVAQGVKIVKQEWLKHFNHLKKYPKLLRCLIADISNKEISVKDLDKNLDTISLDNHLSMLINNCQEQGLPVWVKEIHKDKTGVSIVCAVMPKMERFSIISLGNYVIPTNNYK